MPWTPTGTQENSLKQDIKMKVFSPLLYKQDASEDAKKSQIKYVYELLLNANGYKQAVAVVGAVTSVEEIKKINEYGFDLIKDNSATTIKATLGLIPGVLLLRQQQKLAQDNLNANINGYLGNIHSKYKKHQSGIIQEDGLPFVKEGANNWAVFYNNGFNKLPPGQNIEWYPYVSSTKSSHKRFFTHRGSQSIWYADGGTHGNDDDWWVQTMPGGDWKKL